jgi:hypothetical protein
MKKEKDEKRRKRWNEMQTLSCSINLKKMKQKWRRMVLVYLGAFLPWSTSFTLRRWNRYKRDSLHSITLSGHMWPMRWLKRMCEGGHGYADDCMSTINPRGVGGRKGEPVWWIWWSGRSGVVGGVMEMISTSKS